MDMELARFNMVECQARTWDVFDQRILDALAGVRREMFVPDSHRELAFADLRLPIGHGEVMLEPKLEARLLQEIGLSGKERVLEVGTGSGHFTALLATLARQVVSVDIQPEFINAARGRLEGAGFANIQLDCADACHGYAAGAPYDVIVLTGSVPAVAEELKRQLAPGGRLLVAVGEGASTTTWLITRLDEKNFSQSPRFDMELPPLHCPRQSVFQF